MKKALATLCTIVALHIPTPTQAILGAGYCVEKIPLKIEVQHGDTLIGLARQFYGGDSLKYLDIAAHNGVKNPDRIKAGQILELPGKTYEHSRPVSVSDIAI